MDEDEDGPGEDHPARPQADAEKQLADGCPAPGLPPADPVGPVDQEDHQAMELIAASRIVKAQQRVNGVHAVRRARSPASISALASQLDDRPPAAARRERRARRGRRVLRRHQRPRAGRRLQRQRDQGGARRSTDLLRERGQGGRSPYVVGRKGVGYYRFRGREIAREWTGFSEQPTYADAKEIADALIEAFLTPDRGGRRRRDPHRLHRVRLDGDAAGRSPGGSCRWWSRRPTRSRRTAPLPLYEFEPSAEARARRAAAALRRDAASTPRCSSRRRRSSPPAGAP